MGIIPRGTWKKAPCLVGCVPLEWSGSGLVICDHSDHDTSKELMNPFPGWIQQFLWFAMIWVILDHGSWSGSSQWSASLINLNLLYMNLKDNLMLEQVLIKWLSIQPSWTGGHLKHDWFVSVCMLSIKDLHTKEIPCICLSTVKAHYYWAGVNPSQGATKICPVAWC